MSTRNKMLQEPRSLLIFKQSIRSDETKKVYLNSLDKYRRWVPVDNYDDLLQADEKSIQRLLEDYVMYLKDKISPNSFNTQLAPIFLFYEMNDVNINKRKIKKMFPGLVKRSGYNSYTRTDIQNMLKTTKSKRTKACILILASTGCRAKALLDLKIKDISNYSDGYKIVSFYSGDKEEYFGFLTPEASSALDDYISERMTDGEKITENSPVIRDRYSQRSLPARHIGRQSLESLLEITQKDNQRKHDVSNRYNIPIAGGFRKFFNSVIKLRDGANLSLCEKLMGHSVSITLDNHYLKAPKEYLFKEFLKSAKDLCIDESIRLRIQNDENQTKINQLESEKNKIAELEYKISMIQQLLKKATAA